MKSKTGRIALLVCLFPILFFSSCRKDNVENGYTKHQLVSCDWLLFSHEFKGKEMFDSSFTNTLKFYVSKGQDFYDSSESADFNWYFMESKSVLGNIQLNLRYEIQEINESIGGKFELLKLSKDTLEIRRVEDVGTLDKENWIKRYRSQKR